jgi:ribosomal subunit interface protein
MHVEINYRDLNKSDRLDNHIQDTVQTSFARYQDRLTRIEVHVGDLNGHKAGEDDKRCMMEARAAGRPPVVAEAHTGDIYNAVTDAAHKLERVLERKFAKLAD